MKPMKNLRFLAVVIALGCAVAAYSTVFFSTATRGAARSTIVPPGVERIGEAEKHPAERPFDALLQARAHIAANYPTQSTRAPQLRRSLRVMPEQMALFGLSSPAATVNSPLTVMVFEGPFDVSNAGPGISFASARYITLVYDTSGRQLALTHISADGAGLEKLLSGEAR